jgi:LCP family protein required for cell wall assembly
MILVNVDRDTGRTCLVQIPRDTYFGYTGKSYKKINGAASALGGPAALCHRLGSALSLTIDHYMVVDLEAVAEAVDMLGGVDIDVPCDMDYEDPAQSLSIHLKKGRQHLDGRKALGFIRFRSGYLRADIGRLDAQKLFLAAFFDSGKKLERRDIPRLAMLAAEKVKTNLRVDQMISLMRIGLDTEAEDIVLVTLPGEEVQSDVSGAWYYVLSRSGTVGVLERCFGVENASAGFDPAHLFSDPSRREFETVYRSAIEPQYYEISELVSHGIAVE